MNNIILSEYLDEITKGTTPTTIGGRFVTEGVNFVKAECLNTGRIIDKKSLSYISPEIHKKLNRSILKEGDLLFSIAGHLGKMAIVRNNDLPANTNQAVAILRINQEKADVEFLYYYLCSKQVSDYIGSQCAQSVQPNLNLAQVGELPIIEYPLSYQQKIASVLSALDSKIELNNRINAELEAMAKTLYDYWFVQFDFPDRNGKPYRLSGGKMVWNEELKREVPEGWEVKRIGEVATVKAGGDKPENYTIGKTELNNVPIYSNGITDDGLYGFTNEPIINEQSVTISARGTIGFCVLRNKPFVPIIRLIALTPILSGSAKYFFEALRHFNFENSGSVQQQLTVPQVKGIKLLIPNEDVLKSYDDVTSPMKDRIEILKEENQKLNEFRDWLLPMLMNGQVKVS